MLFYNANVNSSPTLILRVPTYFYCATDRESVETQNEFIGQTGFGVYLFKPPLLLSLTGHAEFHLHKDTGNPLPK